MTFFGDHFVFAVRCFQLVLGIVTVGVCALVAFRLFDRQAAEATFIFGLFLPTLVFSTAQVLTECFAAFFTTLYLYFLVNQYYKRDAWSAWGLGLTAGLASLVRFNAAALPLFSGGAVFQSRHQNSRLAGIAVVLFVPVLVVMPWFVRNWLVFGGRVFYSTQTGINAVEGVLTPQGRTQPADTGDLLNGLNCCAQLETNDDSRLSLPSEVEINKRALRLVPGLWMQQGWHAAPLLGRKVIDFWLSTDQLIDTRSFPIRERIIRVGGVLAYWVVLGLSACGWLVLRRLEHRLAVILLGYAVGFTALHLPFVMNTRLRIPLMEPLIVILCGMGWVRMVRDPRRVLLPEERLEVR